MDWFVWRLLSADRLSATLGELTTVWSHPDMLDAHEVLDMLDELSARAQAASEDRR